MQTANVTIDPSFVRGEIDPRLYGSFIEHVGRCVYGGIYEPDHPTADDTGFRGDLLDEVRQLGIPLYRYPGGCFVSAYEWEHGIGPRAERSRVLDLAWRVTETNQVGVDEFCEWTRRANAAPFMVVNTGTRGLDAARNLIEYCNHPEGSLWSDKRIANGYREPHAIKVWGLGNEPDTDFELGGKTAHEYALLARETAKAMRRVDPSIELVVCGSTRYNIETYASWDATVLEHTYDLVDHVAIHAYYGKRDDDTGSYLGSTLEMEEFINGTIATCDHVRTKLKRQKYLTLSFDEWNVAWYHNTEADQAIEPWGVAPAFMEDVFTFEDALMFGAMGITLLQHADRIKMGGQSTLVNNVGLFLTKKGGPTLRQTLYYPFRHIAIYGRGVTLDARVQSPFYHSRRFGAVPALHAVITHDQEREELAIFALNRSADQPLEMTVELHGFGGYRVLEHIVLENENRNARNTFEAPETVVPHARGDAVCSGGKLTAMMPPLSWHVIRLTAQPDQTG